MSAWINVFKEESLKTIALALPMIMGQMGQLFLSVVDTIMVGRVGLYPLAGVSFGGALMLFVLIVGMGLCSGVHVLVSRLTSMNDQEEASEVLKHGVWVVLFYAIPIALAMTFGIRFLYWFGQPVEVVEEAKMYVIFMAWSVVSALVFRCFRNYSEAWNHPWPPFFITLFAIMVNVLLNWIFIFGHWGAPAMGASGAGLATFLARTIALAGCIYVIFRTPRFELGWTFLNFFQCHWGLLKRVLSIGVPTLVQISFELGFFVFAMVMMGWLGTLELAVQQVATAYTALMFMIPLGISFAVTIRVGESIGRQDYEGVRRVGFSGMGLGALLMLIISFFTFGMRYHIPAWINQDFEVINLVAYLLAFGALWQVWDGIQVVAMGALRGMEDVCIPLGIVVFSYWIVGTSLGYYTAFHLGWGAGGIWVGLIVGLFIGASLLLWRFQKVSAKFQKVLPRE